MAGYLTTHVLDTARGQPAAALEIELYQIQGEKKKLLKKTKTNDDGRTDEQLLSTSEFEMGTYELVFYCGAYFDEAGLSKGADKFLDVIPLRFSMSEDTHYHVPLLVSPFSYSTYRGS